MNSKIEQEVLNLLQRNKEELKHAKDTLNWLLILKPDSDFIIRISALGHDIEKGVYGKDKEKHESHKDFKMAHSKRSADIMKDIFLKYGKKKKDIQRMHNIILNHEFGGNSEANLVKDADSLANFQWCDDMFEKLNKYQLENTMQRMYNRMEPENKKFAKQVKLKHAEVKVMLNIL